MAAVQPEWEWLFQVTLLHASNLPIVHRRNRIFEDWKAMDPYCVFYINGKVVASSTSIKDGNTNPTWKEAFNIRVHDGIASLPDTHILVYIAHLDPKHKPGYHRPIGTASIPLSEFPVGEWREMELNVDAAKSAYPGETQATINVRLQKQMVTVNGAAADTTPPDAAQAASSKSHSRSGEYIQIFLSAAQVGIALAGGSS